MTINTASVAGSARKVSIKRRCVSRFALLGQILALGGLSRKSSCQAADTPIRPRLRNVRVATPPSATVLTVLRGGRCRQRGMRILPLRTARTRIRRSPSIRDVLRIRVADGLGGSNWPPKDSPFALSTRRTRIAHRSSQPADWESAMIHLQFAIRFRPRLKPGNRGSSGGK